MGTIKSKLHQHPMLRPWRGSAAAVAAAVLLAISASAAPVHAQELTVEKVVSQVNGSAPPATEVISVSPGDDISFAISVSSVADLGGTDVVIRDVFQSQVLDFRSASSNGCTASAGEVTCTLSLDNAGATEVELTFRVLEVDNCRRLVNTAQVEGAGNLTASAEAEIEACPAGGDGQGNGNQGNGNQGNGASPVPGNGGGQDTAMLQPVGSTGRPSLATIAGLLLILLAAASGVLRWEWVRTD